MNSQSDVISLIHCSYDKLMPQPTHQTIINDSTNKVNEKANLPGRSAPQARKSKRRVRFPDGEVISNYLEPFRPVPDNCTSEELIAAYLESCLQYKVSPIDFLLEQLKGIDLSICNERYSRLSLKGIRLNRSHVETLEEIFRRVHFRELDFEGTYLDEQSAVALFDMLLHYETCHELHISLNLDKFHPSLAWTRCVTFMRRSGELRRFALSHTPLTISNFLGLNFFGLCLHGLSLRDCNLSGQALFGLVRWLRLLLSSSSLDPPSRDRSGGLGHNNSRGTSRRSGASMTGPTARRNNMWRSVLVVDPESGMCQPSVWELKLNVSQNRLNAADAETLLALIRHQLLVPRIPSHVSDLCPPSTELPESDQGMDEHRGLKKEWLPVGGIGFLSDLDLSNNSLGDDGLRVICAGLIQSYRTRLRDLHANAPSIPGDEAQPSDSFVTCSTSDSPKDDKDQESHTMEKVQTCVRGLERLSVANNGITTVGMQSMAVVLMQTPLSLVHLVGGLISLDLSNNPGIRDEGVEILCDGLIRNHSLKELYLRSIRMSFTGIFALSSFLSEAKCLRLLDIRSNYLDLAGLMALAKTLSLNRTLTSLLSDARSMTSNQDPIIATDAELILYLIDEIDQFLRRNRASQQTPPVPVTKVLELPSSTSNSIVDSEPTSPIESNPNAISDLNESSSTRDHNNAFLSIVLTDEEDNEEYASSVTNKWSDKTLVELRGSFEMPESPSDLFGSSPLSSVAVLFEDDVNTLSQEHLSPESVSLQQNGPDPTIPGSKLPPIEGSDGSWEPANQVKFKSDSEPVSDLPVTLEPNPVVLTNTSDCSDTRSDPASGGTTGGGRTRKAKRKHMKVNSKGKPMVI